MVCDYHRVIILSWRINDIMTQTLIDSDLGSNDRRASDSGGSDDTKTSVESLLLATLYRT